MSWGLAMSKFPWVDKGGLEELSQNRKHKFYDEKSRHDFNVNLPITKMIKDYYLKSYGVSSRDSLSYGRNFMEISDRFHSDNNLIISMLLGGGKLWHPDSILGKYRRLYIKTNETHYLTTKIFEVPTRRKYITMEKINVMMGNCNEYGIEMSLVKEISKNILKILYSPELLVLKNKIIERISQVNSEINSNFKTISPEKLGIILQPIKIPDSDKIIYFVHNDPSYYGSSTFIRISGNVNLDFLNWTKEKNLTVEQIQQFINSNNQLKELIYQNIYSYITYIEKLNSDQKEIYLDATNHLIKLIDSLDIEYKLSNIINMIVEMRIDENLPLDFNKDLDIYELRSLIAILQRDHPIVLQQFLNKLGID
jgi:hypothetical protein